MTTAVVRGTALGLIVVVVVLLVGRNRRAASVLTAAGSLLMVATCAVLGLKVNFLDFVALPITLGIGVDYAINVAHRHDHEPDPITTLRTSAVFVCSLTTIIGYGSLLISENLAIRGFGLASLIGEIALRRDRAGPGACPARRASQAGRGRQRIGRGAIPWKLDLEYSIIADCVSQSTS